MPGKLPPGGAGCGAGASMACLDTSVLLDLLGRGGRGPRTRAASFLRELVARGEPLTTTRLNVAELYVGVERSRSPAREEEAVLAVLSGLQILEFEERSARAFAKLTAYLQTRGRPAGDMDVLIASVALVSGESLITRDVRHFAALPGLTVPQY